MRTHLTIVSCAAIAAALGTPLITHAAVSNSLTNGSFEDFPIGGAPNGIPADGSSPFYVLPNGSVALTGWTVTKGSVDVVPNALWQSSTNTPNSFSIDLVGTPSKSGDPTPQTGGITQTVSGLTAGHLYQFSYWVSVNPGSDSYNDQLKNKILSVLVTAPVGQENTDVQFAPALSGTTDLYAPDNLVLADGTRTFTNMQWQQITTSFIVPTSSITISFAAILNDLTHPTSAATNNILTGPVIDNISLIDLGGGGGNPSPEPASLGFLGTGFVALATRRHRAK